MQQLKSVMALIVVCGMLGMAGCGGKKEVKPETTPIVAATALTPAPTTEPTPVIESRRYSVQKGDTLWDISGTQAGYADHFQWPLIFKANRDQIQDPDFIEIDQDLAISREFSQAEAAHAVENAKKTPRYKKHAQPYKHLPIEY